MSGSRKTSSVDHLAAPSVLRIITSSARRRVDGHRFGAPPLMNNDKFRRQIAFEAARLMYDRQESEYFRAKLRAAKRICLGWGKPKDLPSNAEIRDQIQHFPRLHEAEDRAP